MFIQNVSAALLAAFFAAPPLALAAPPQTFDRCVEVSILPLVTGNADTDEFMQDTLERAARGMVDALVARNFDAVPLASGRVAVAPAVAAPGAAVCGWQALWSLSVTGQSPAFVVTYSATVRHLVRESQGTWTWGTDLRYEHVTRGLDAFLASVPANFGRDAVAQLEDSQRIPGLHEIGKTTEDDVRAACRRVERAMSHDFLVRTMTFAKRADATQAVKRLDHGESFEAVGRALLPRTDPASFAPIWGSPFDWNRVFTSEVVAAAPRGLVPAPVRVDDGWVVVEVEDRRSRPVAPCGGIEVVVRRSLSQ